MKKYLSKIVSLLMCCALSLTLVACGDNNSGNTGNNGNSGNEGGNPDNKQNSSIAYNEFIDTYVDTINKEVVSDSDIVLYTNGTTDYKIVVSSDSYSQISELKAAEEINFFMKDAVGIEFPVLVEGKDEVASATDADGNFVTTNKYICIGNTSFYKASPMYNTFDYSDMGNDGFKIQTHGNTVIMNSLGNNGIVYSAYGFLQRNMDYHYYAQDEWRITHDSTRFLKNMDVVDVPEFQSRMLDTATNTSDTSDWLVRLRHHGSQGSRYNYEGMEAAGWKLGDQSLCLELLRANKYYHDKEDEVHSHGNWYTGDGLAYTGQMCISTVLQNNEEADGCRPLDKLFEELVQKIEAYPNDRVFMLGINDNQLHQCPGKKNGVCRCAEEFTTIKYSGQMCLLANALMKRVLSWQAGTYNEDYNVPVEDVPLPNEHDQNRVINLSFFAYLYTIDAPVEYNPVTNDYDIIAYDAPYEDFGGNGKYGDEAEGDGDDNDLALMDNIIVRIAPIRSVNMHTHYDTEYNNSAYLAFENWKEISPILAVWDYGTTFSDYLAPYPDWGVIQDDFKYFRACNVKELLTQLPAHTSGTSFYALMLYLRAELMWDMDQDVEFLIKDFFYNYYGPQAFDAMYGYFNWLRNYFQMMDAVSYNENGDKVEGLVNADGKRIYYHGYIYTIFTTAEYFPYVTINQLKKYFTEAERQIELVKNTEPKYQKYLDRVHVESLFVRYIDLKEFYLQYSNDELADMIDKFEAYAEIGNLTRFDNSKATDAPQQLANFVKRMRNLLT